MPFLRLTITPAPAASAAYALAERLTNLMAERLGKKAALTSVLVEPAHGLWTIGGAAQPAAAHLEATITAGTNTETEKAAFIAEAMTLLRAHLPDLHAATYVTLREAAATDWGYDGRTQAARRAEASSR
jgi:4-oxalocrotonate tautomerase